MAFKLFEKCIHRALAQILFWGSIFAAMNLMFIGADVPAHFRYRNFIQIFCIISLVLLNSFVFVPRYFSQKKYAAYAAVVAVSIIVFMFFSSSVEHLFFENMRDAFPKREGMPESFKPPKPDFFFFDPRYFFNIIIYSAVALVGTVIESVQLNRKQEARASRMENEKLETELKFLKSQINPHFLFNVLNNVYTLSLIQSEQTPEVVMKLSEMLRYMLYESNNEKVSLGQEVQYIENYVSLQQLKDDVPLSVETTFNTNNPKARIAPMILIPFVENAFKHSKIEDTENGWIEINLTEEGDSITFEVSNSMAETDSTKDPTGGIGLSNVRRRLELEYPEKHRLEIKQDDDKFYVDLTINNLT